MLNNAKEQIDFFFSEMALRGLYPQKKYLRDILMEMHNKKIEKYIQEFFGHFNSFEYEEAIKALEEETLEDAKKLEKILSQDKEPREQSRRGKPGKFTK